MKEGSRDKPASERLACSSWDKKMQQKQLLGATARYYCNGIKCSCILSRTMKVLVLVYMQMLQAVLSCASMFCRTPAGTAGEAVEYTAKAGELGAWQARPAPGYEEAVRSQHAGLCVAHEVLQVRLSPAEGRD
jgi:hypothetical protein